MTAQMQDQAAAIEAAERTDAERAERAEQRAQITGIVIDFTKEFINRRIAWQASQIVPGATPGPALIAAMEHLHNDPPEAALRYVMEPNEWLRMALYGAGLIDSEAGEIREICQSLAEWLFSIPGSNTYEIPQMWATTPLGSLFWRALIRTEGDELITITQAAKVAGRTVQAISNRIDRGTMGSFTDPLAKDRQGRRLVRLSDAARLSSAGSEETIRIK